MSSFFLYESLRRHAITVVAVAEIVSVADRVLDDGDHGGDRPEAPFGCG